MNCPICKTSLNLSEHLDIIRGLLINEEASLGALLVTLEESFERNKRRGPAKGENRKDFEIRLNKLNEEMRIKRVRLREVKELKSLCISTSRPAGEIPTIQE